MLSNCEVNFWSVGFLKEKALLYVAIIIAAPLFLHGVAVAQAPTSTIISAQITAVRYVIVNNDNVITEISSNTKEDVTPTVCRDDCSKSIINFTQNIYHQYKKLMTTIDTSHTGVIYQAKVSFNEKFIGISKNTFREVVKTLSFVLPPPRKYL